MKRFFVVSYAGDKFAAATLPEAYDLACLEPNKTGYWCVVQATDEGAARLGHGEKIEPWSEFSTDARGYVRYNHSEHINCLVDGHHGIYVPSAFASNFDMIAWSVTEENKAILAKGPDYNPEYWDTWEEVLTNAEHKDDKGNTWYLYQDGDLFAVMACECPDEEREKFVA